jgi:hypothetical protein
LSKAFFGYVTQETWKHWYLLHLIRKSASARESAIYDQLKEGPVFQEAVEHIIPRKALVEEIRRVTTPVRESRLYPVIIGEHRTGKTSLIKFIMDGMDEPKGVVYLDINLNEDSELNVAKLLRNALGWSPDQVIDPIKRNYSSSLLVKHHLRLTDSQRQRQRHLYGRLYKNFLVSPSNTSGSMGKYQS